MTEVTLDSVKEFVIETLKKYPPNIHYWGLEAQINQDHGVPKREISHAVSALVKEGALKKDGRFYSLTSPGVPATQESMNDSTAEGEPTPPPVLTVKPLTLVRATEAAYLSAPYRRAYVRHLCGVAKMRANLDRYVLDNRKQARKLKELESELAQARDNSEAAILRATLDRENKKLAARGYTGNLSDKIDQLLHALAMAKVG